jgi:hypothetical protein
MIGSDSGAREVPVEDWPMAKKANVQLFPRSEALDIFHSNHSFADQPPQKKPMVCGSG